MAYVNPFSRISGLVPERIDQGVDFSGDGPILAIGNAVVVRSVSNSGASGWPGNPGGFVSYRLLDGPAAGRIVYVAEDITPTVREGQQVSAGQQIATFHATGTGLETGWASGQGTSTLSALGSAGGIQAGGPFPTKVGINFDQLLVSLGVKPSPGINSSGSGANPGLPSWTGNVPGVAGTTPVVPASSTGITAALASSQYNAATCAWGLDLATLGTPQSFFGFKLPSLQAKVGFCILSKTQVRALLGGLLVGVGTVVVLYGSTILVVYTFKRAGALDAITQLLQFIPGVGKAASVVKGKIK